MRSVTISVSFTATLDLFTQSENCEFESVTWHICELSSSPQDKQHEGLAVASIARDDPSPLPACTVTTVHFHHRKMDTDIVA